MKTPEHRPLRSKMQGFLDAAATRVFDPFFDEKWDYDKECKLPGWSERMKVLRECRASALEALLGL